MRAFLDQWETGRPLEAFPEEARAKRPFGLIEQGLALLHVRASADTHADKHVQLALAHFDKANQPMGRGGTLLELLAALAKLRRRVFALERRNTPTTKQNVAASFRDVQSHFEECGEHVWGEEDAGRSYGLFGGRDPGPGQPWLKRARAVLAGVRFNYW